jgi:hypothetical protein
MAKTSTPRRLTRTEAPPQASPYVTRAVPEGQLRQYWCQAPVFQERVVLRLGENGNSLLWEVFFTSAGNFDILTGTIGQSTGLMARMTPMASGGEA